MTDKQIIIDGVDVSDCGYLNACDKKMKCVLLQDDICEVNPYCEGFNCDYKQLKRVEQELIDYKKQFKADTKEMEDYQNEIIRHLESIEYWQHQAKAKEQECDQLKDEKWALVSRAELETKSKEFFEERVRDLEQECEELKAKCKKYGEINEQETKDYAELKAENERLKKGIFKLDKTQPQVILTEGQVSLMYCTFLDMELKTTKLEQTLTEIKKIAKYELNNLTESAINSGRYVEILQKISECEV